MVYQKTSRSRDQFWPYETKTTTPRDQDQDHENMFETKTKTKTAKNRSRDLHHCFNHYANQEKLSTKAKMRVFPSISKIENKPDCSLKCRMQEYRQYFDKKNQRCSGRLAQLLSSRYRCGTSGVQFPGRSNRLSVVNGSQPLRRFFGAAQALDCGDGLRHTSHASA